MSTLSGGTNRGSDGSVELYSYTFFDLRGYQARQQILIALEPFEDGAVMLRVLRAVSEARPEFSVAPHPLIAIPSYRRQRPLKAYCSSEKHLAQA
jgi:hypothetical protein